MRILLRLMVLGLAAYGGWKLYEEYGDRLPAMRGDLDEFSTRTANAAKDASEQLSSAANDATSALKSSASDIQDAAKDAKDNLSRSASEPPSVSTTWSS